MSSPEIGPDQILRSWIWDRRLDAAL